MCWPPARQPSILRRLIPRNDFPPHSEDASIPQPRARVAISPTATVLVAEENDGSRVAITRPLQNAGYRVVEAATGAGALRLAKLERPDLAILDGLPDLDGLAITGRLRADPATRSLPILFISRVSEGGTAQARALEGGADAWLPHPPDPEVVVATARALLRVSRAEATLHAHEARTRMLLEQVQEHAIFLLTPDARVASWNEGVRRALGYDEDEFIGLDARALFTPEDRVAGVPEQELATARATGVASDDRWMLRKDGTRLWASGATSALRDHGDQLAGYAKVLRDLTETKRAQDALRDSQHRLQIAVSTARLGSWDHDPSTGAVTWLPGTAALFGQPEGAFAGTADAFLDLIHPDDRTRVREAILTPDLEAERGLEFRVLRADGAVAWIYGTSQAQPESPGRIARVVGVGIDVTEQKMSQERVQLAAKMQAVGQLAGGIAHEINNQIMALMGFTEFLGTSLPAEDARQNDLAEVTKAAKRVAFITRQLLAFSRQEMRQITTFTPNTVLSGMEGLLQRVLGSDFACLLELDPRVDAVEMDPAQFEGIILNLALNARDAMPRGGRLTISTGALQMDDALQQTHESVEIPLGRYVRITINDTGHGMDEATRQRAFEPFFTTKPVGQGTGLGLASVYGVVKQSNGFIWLESAPGRGTTVHIDLPVAQADAVPADAPSPGHDHQAGAGTVLLVEDENNLRDVLSRMLVQEGFRVHAVSDAATALAALADRPRPDVVLTDLVMPGMSGWEFGQGLARTMPDLPLVYMTGYAEEEVIRRGLYQPGATLLRKPFTAPELAATLRDARLTARRP